MVKQSDNPTHNNCDLVMTACDAPILTSCTNLSFDIVVEALMRRLRSLNNPLLSFR